MRSRHRKGENLSLVAFSNFAITFAKAMLVMFLVAFALISTTKKVIEGVKPNAQYIITVDWPASLDVDVDSWIRLPSGVILFYKSRDGELVNIDRDDTGNLNDKIVQNGQLIINPANEEIITIRGIVSGEYVLNIQMYRFGSAVKNAVAPAASGSPGAASTTEYPNLAGRPLPTNIIVTVNILKLNPKVEVVYSKTVTLTLAKQELHICRFTITGEGSITDINDTRPTSLVSTQTSDVVPPEGSSQ